MSQSLSPADAAKRAAANRAVAYVNDGMRVGLGTGSTAAFMVRALGDRVRKEGLKIRGVPTSARTAQLAREVGIDVITLDEAQRLDLTIDGADEFDPELNLIKGGGGALLQEKIVATASDRMIVITDAAKQVDALGAFPLPVEVIRFGCNITRAAILRMLGQADVARRDVTLRMDGDAPYVTDEGNHILDLHLDRIGDARKMAADLNQIAGVVENGLFIGICNTVLIGHNDGQVDICERG